METMQNNWAAAVRKVCDSDRGTILCEVRKTGAAALIRYDAVCGLRLARVSDCRETSTFRLSDLRVSEEVAARLATIASEIARQDEIASEVALLRFEQTMARKADAGRWKSSGQFRTRGAVQAGG